MDRYIRSTPSLYHTGTSDRIAAVTEFRKYSTDAGMMKNEGKYHPKALSSQPRVTTIILYLSAVTTLSRSIVAIKKLTLFVLQLFGNQTDSSISHQFSHLKK